jgi:hypothetical protein
VQAIEDEVGNGCPAVDVGHTQSGQAAQGRVPQATLHDDADRVLRPRDELVELPLDDVAPGRRQSCLKLPRLHRIRERRQVDALDAEAWCVEWGEPADRGFDVIATHHGAAQMAGADADAEEDRLVARFREAKALLHEPLKARQSVARIEERHARFQGRQCVRSWRMEAPSP